jgi:hypothetical protein
MINECETPTVRTAFNAQMIRAGVRAGKTIDAYVLNQIDKTSVKTTG